LKHKVLCAECDPALEGESPVTGEVAMKKWLRRIRGAIGMGLTWGAAWLGAGLVLLLIVGVGAADVPFPLFFGLLGFLAGATFSGILGLVEGRRRFDEMSLPRFAGWGAVGGLLLAAIFVAAAGLEGELLALGPVFALAGAGSAAGTLALARRARERGSLDANADGARSRLAEDEARELLGGGG
jgi:hypothetical protein